MRLSLSFGGRRTAKADFSRRHSPRVRKRGLEIALESLAGHPTPSPRAEQYVTPAAIAADVLWFAYSEGDIAGRRVDDLGCGTGILAIGAALLGAAGVVGIDSDAAAIAVARQNARRLRATVRFLVRDVRVFRGRADTVVMNPPFGAQTRHADRPFLEAAVRVAPVVYLFANGATEPFILRTLHRLGAEPTHRSTYAFPIPRRFAFHREDRREVPVVVFRATRRAAKL